MSEPRSSGAPHATPLDPGRAAACLAWALAFAYSFAPFNFTLSHGAITENFEKVLQARGFTHLLLHVLAFAAVGAAERFGSEERDQGNRVFPAVLARGFLFCLVIEIGQVFLPFRHAALADLAVNAAGLLLGHPGVRRLFQLHPNAWQAMLRLRSRRLGFSLLVTWGLFWSSLVLLPARLVTLDDWDPTYPLLIGNERGGERAWEGEIQYVGIYDRALGADDMTRILDQPPGVARTTGARLEMGLLVAYDFTRVGRFDVEPEGALTAPGLRIGLPARSRWSRGTPAALVLDEGALLASAGPAEPLSTLIASSGAFSVEVWFRPADLFQGGPARIVGISDGPWRRNFTVGQDGKAIHFRVRNHLNGPNGTEFELRSPEALSENLLQIVATYDHGISSIFRNGHRLSPTVDLREPSVLLALGTRPAGRVVTALLSALSLILFSSCFPGRIAATQNLLGLLVIGYGSLLVPLALSALLPFRPATSLYVWFGPALVLSWMCFSRELLIGYARE